ncbi:hypothetical protein [Actinacidiphila glaucinigra]|nr:hypothetical protein [Actinacidiphila glaucinigra]
MFDLELVAAVQASAAGEALQLMEQHQIKRLPMIDTEQGHEDRSQEDDGT